MDEKEIFMDALILRKYIQVIILIIMTIIYLISLIRKKRWIKWEKTSPDMKQTIKKHEKTLNNCSKIFVGTALIFMYLVMGIPLIMDIPNVISEKYLSVEGEVVEWNFSREDQKKERSIGIIDSKTNQKVNVVVYSYGIQKGEYIEAIYLPHSKYGVVKE